MKYFYIIETSKSEQTSSYDFITDNFEEARAHVKDFADWYTSNGTCTILKIDQNFHKVKQWEYEEDKLVDPKTHWWMSDCEKEDHD